MGAPEPASVGALRHFYPTRWRGTALPFSDAFLLPLESVTASGKELHPLCEALPSATWHHFAPVPVADEKLGLCADNPCPCEWQPLPAEELLPDVRALPEPYAAASAWRAVPCAGAWPAGLAPGESRWVQRHLDAPPHSAAANLLVEITHARNGALRCSCNQWGKLVRSGAVGWRTAVCRHWRAHAGDAVCDEHVARGAALAAAAVVLECTPCAASA